MVHIFLRPSLWILLLSIIVGYIVADAFGFDTGLGIMVGMILGAIFITKTRIP